MSFFVRLFFAVTFLFSIAAHAEDHHSQEQQEVTISTTQVSDHIYMLQGEGGNIGLALDEHHTLMVDDQFAPLSDKIKAAIAELSDKPVKLLVNTHFHFDHTGGNEVFAKDGAVIIAHDKVHHHLKEGATIEAFDKVMEPYPVEALPVITHHSGMRVHQGNKAVELVHYMRAHTDSDTAVFFTNANVVHTGDIYFSGMYPFIDTSNGGSIDGMIAAMTLILDRLDENSKVIPGHGPLSDKATMKADLAMLEAFAKAIKEAKAKGDSLEAIVAANILPEYDDPYSKGVLNKEAFVGMIYRGVE